MEAQIPEVFEYLFEPAPFKGAFGGRGSAKSHSIASALLIKGRENVEFVGCFREVQNSIKDSVKRLLDNKINEYGWRNFYRSTNDGIFGANGTQFVFKGLRGEENAEAVKSLEGVTKAWIEEAQTISQASLDILIPTVFRLPTSELWASWNPKKKTDAIDVLLRGETLPPGAIVREVNYEHNPFFPEGLRKLMEWDKLRDKDKYAHIWRGAYQTHSETRVFKNWRIAEFEAPFGAQFLQGADWGYAVDPSCIVRCFIGRWENGRAVRDINGHNLFIDHEALMIGCEIEDLPKLFAGKEGATEKEQAAWSPLDDDKWPGIPNAMRTMIVADSARPETISYMKRRSFRIEAALKGKGSVEDGISWLKNYDIIVHPRCVHTIDELSFYSWKFDEKTQMILPILEDKKNHIIDSLRYAVEKARSGLAVWEKLGRKR